MLQKKWSVVWKNKLLNFPHAYITRWSMPNHEVTFEQRERVFHRDIQTRENNVWKHEAEGRVFLLIVFECLDIPVGHELELFK